MLSSIGRTAIRRVGAEAGSTNKLLQSAWLVHRVDASARTQFALSLRRLYATSLKTAKAANKVSKTSAKPKPKTKKAAPKKTTAKAVKKKPVKKRAVKKKVAAKPKPKAKPRKVLTPAEKEKAHIKKLKAAALLTAPSEKPRNSWMVFFVQHAQKGVSSATTAKEASAKFKSLSPAEIEQLNHTANQNRSQNAIAYKAWLKSHTPDQIRIANNARKLLKKKLNKRMILLHDERIPKRGTSPWNLFVGERFASGDFKGISMVDSALLMRKEFNALPPGELKIFQDKAAASKLRYEQEFKTVFHRDTFKVEKEKRAA